MNLLVNYGIKAAQKKALQYLNATGGTTFEYTLSGKRYRSHTFTSVGTTTFTVTQLASDPSLNILDYLIIAGGGGGGFSGGGGGAGGYRTTNGTSGGNSAAEVKITPTLTSYSIVVGAGGNQSSGLTSPPSNGGNSSAFGITSTGGGAGGNYYVNYHGVNGGSGGGGGSYFSSGNKGLGTANQGNDGGNGSTDNSTYRSGGGGGGAGAAGTNSTGNLGGGVSNGGNGGNGLSNILRTGVSETRAGGGGGYPHANGVPGTGGSGGGGAGKGGANVNGNPGQINTGSGGGNGTNSASANGNNGGSGIVVIRYEIAPTILYQLNSPMDVFPTNYGWVYSAGDGSSSVSNGILTMTSGSGQGPQFEIIDPPLFNSVNNTLTIETRLKVNFTGGVAFAAARILFSDTQRNFIFYLKTSSISYFNSSNTIVTAASGLSLTNYTTITFVKNGTNNIVISLDGTPVATIPYTSISTDFFGNPAIYKVAYDAIVSSQTDIDYFNFKIE